MTGTSVMATGHGVGVPSTSLESTTLKAGSRVLTVCVREIATAANDKLAATWPIACIAAGPKSLENSSLVMGRWKEADLKPRKYVTMQYSAPTTTWMVDTNHGKGKTLKRDLFVRLNPMFRPHHMAMKPSVTALPAFFSPTTFETAL